MLLWCEVGASEFRHRAASLTHRSLRSKLEQEHFAKKCFAGNGVMMLLSSDLCLRRQMLQKRASLRSGVCRSCPHCRLHHLMLSLPSCSFATSSLSQSDSTRSQWLALATSSILRNLQIGLYSLYTRITTTWQIHKTFTECGTSSRSLGTRKASLPRLDWLYWLCPTLETKRSCAITCVLSIPPSQPAS